VNLVWLAVCHRAVLLMVALAAGWVVAVIGWFFVAWRAPAPSLETFAILGGLLLFVLWASIVRLGVALRVPATGLAYCAIIGLFPPFNVLLAIGLDRDARRIFERAGVRTPLWGLGSRLRLQLREGACTHCGYSLRGLTPDVCPECGVPVNS
jgi:hypothetical protein